MKRPNLVIMDIIMPEMNGVETTRQIMRSSPCPILVVTSSVHSNSALVFEAMGNGALDAVNTPVLMGESAGSAQEALLLKISMLNVLTKSRSSDTVSVVPRVIKEPICFERTSEKALESASEKSTEKAAENACASDFSIAAERSANKKPALQSISLVAIGASSGGPQALATVLKGLPADYNSAIYKMCASAKLYESFTCLMDKRGSQVNKYYIKTEDKMKTYISGKLKPHNPLVDAYYTLYVFIQFNLR